MRKIAPPIGRSGPNTMKASDVETMAAAFRNPQALASLDAVIERLSKPGDGPRLAPIATESPNNAAHPFSLPGESPMTEAMPHIDTDDQNPTPALLADVRSPRAVKTVTRSDLQGKVAKIKAEVLPALFENPKALGEYGAADDNGQTLDNFSDLMEKGSVATLASRIGDVVAKLADADPKRIAQKPSWLERITGRDVERHVRYEVARKSLDELLIESEVQAQGVRDTLAAIDGLLASHSEEVADLQAYIQAGREYLSENPEAGKRAPGELEFDRPRERFARKLANLTTLLASHEMSVTQMKLTRAQAVDMLDRFNETARVLVPVL